MGAKRAVRRGVASVLVAFAGAVVFALGVAPRTGATEFEEYVRADFNYSGEVDISDVIASLVYLFRGGRQPLCAPIANANATGDVDVSDSIYLLAYLFRGGPSPTPLTEEETAECEDIRASRCGEGVFFARDPLGNAFHCSLCHSQVSADATAPGNRIRPGHGLGDVLGRPSFHNGATTDIEAAINRCRLDWMDAPALAPDDQRMRDLLYYIDSFRQTEEPSPPVSFEIVEPAVTGPSAGDAETGCELFLRACESCHGRHGAGIDALGPTLWGETITTDRVREHTRLSGPTIETVPDTLYTGLLGNRMPFFSRQRLGDVDLEHIAAYIEAIQEPHSRNCDRVGPDVELLRGGPFRTFDHGVRGIAEHWSDSRIIIRDFFYDGQGPELVVVWLYDKDETVLAILSGQAISTHLARDEPYTGVEMEFVIPSNISRRDFNTVSIWCTFYEQNYGEAFLFK